MKIKKNLSDQEMLKNFKEEDSFETAVFKDTPQIKQPVKKEEPKTMLALPDDIVQKLDKSLLQLRFDLKQKGINEVKWNVTLVNGEIILKAMPKKK